jgi:nucleotide-binding universal stress UspA family protein
LKALEQAGQIAEKFSGKITLIHVYSLSIQPIMLPEPSTPSSPSMPILTGEDLSRMTEAARATGKRILNDGEEKLRPQKVEVKKMLVEGHAVQEIVRVANEDNYELIVIGARGISHIEEILLGSVTDGVIHHARCPVLVIK